MDKRKNDRERLRYGICLNDDCPKCKAKEVQAVPMRKEFVCEECGQELRECPPPKKKNPKPVIFICIAVLVIAGIVAAIMLIPKGDKKAEPAPQDELQVEVVAEEPAAPAPAVEEPKVEPQPEPKKAEAPKPANKVDYGKWSGAWKNGKPNGTGTMTFSVNHLIDSRDPDQRVATRGDYIVGEYSEGKLVQGVWYDSDGTVKGSIIIGK